MGKYVWGKTPNEKMVKGKLTYKPKGFDIEPIHTLKSDRRRVRIMLADIDNGRLDSVELTKTQALKLIKLISDCIK